MPVSLVLDIVLVVLLIGFLISGFRSGFVRSAGGMLGFVAGGVAAFFVVPLVGGWVPDPAWRTPAALGSALVLLVVGTTLGSVLGNTIRRRLRRSPLRVVDRVLGAALAVTAAALVASIVGFSIAALGVPFLSPAVSSSAVLRTIDGLTPAPARTAIAQARAFVLADGVPRIVDALRGDVPSVPAEAAATPELAEAAASVVRITGTAYACGQNRSGSGFVVAPDRVMTNAHVVAGVVEPVVESPGGQSLPGRVVYFDPVDDLAVVRVSGLDADPLPRAGDPAPGTEAVTNGYPFGGPFDSDPAVVVSVASTPIADIYGGPATDRSVVTLASEVQQGESGGPLLTTAGRVAGVVFARDAARSDVGYALAMTEVEPVAAAAGDLVEPVASGSCATA